MFPDNCILKLNMYNGNIEFRLPGVESEKSPKNINSDANPI